MSFFRKSNSQSMQKVSIAQEFMNRHVRDPKRSFGAEVGANDSLSLGDKTVVCKQKQANFALQSSILKKRAKGLSSKERRHQSVTKLRQLPCETVQNMRDLWQSYAEEILTKSRLLTSNTTKPDAMPDAFAQQHLLKMDLTGCVLRVLHSQCAPQVGMEGTVVMETKHMFYLADETGRVRQVAKKNADFSFSLPGPSHHVVIFGAQFLFRPGERVTRRWKNVENPRVNYELLLDQLVAEKEAAAAMLT